MFNQILRCQNIMRSINESLFPTEEQINKWKNEHKKKVMEGVRVDVCNPYFNVMLHDHITDWCGCPCHKGDCDAPAMKYLKKQICAKNGEPYVWYDSD